jgi:hypothetical protein
MDMRRGKFLTVLILSIAVIATIIYISWPEGNSTTVIIPNRTDLKSGNDHDGVWMNSSLTDVMSSEQFQIRDLSSSPVLILAFTIPCPICNEQQREIGRLRMNLPDLQIVGLAIDPYERPESLKDYVIKNGFSGKYVIATEEVDTSLLKNFGMQALTPSEAPVFIICRAGEVRLLTGGMKPASMLQAALSGCSNGSGS